MKKFSEFKQFRKINEQEVQLKSTETKSEEQPQENQLKPEQQSQTTTEKSGASKFASKMFESREMAHVYHLQVKGDTGSHAAHLALNEYYDEILEFIDDLIEAYQGQYEIIEEYQTIDTTDTKTKDKLDYFNELAQFIKENRKTCFNQEDTHLQNTIDEMLALVYRTIYKLKYTK